MKNSISLKKNWEDGDLLSVNASIASENIALRSCYYTTKMKIQNLQARLKDFLVYPGESFFWSSGTVRENEVPMLCLKFEYVDVCGHIRIEVTAEVDDGGEESPYHKCCFNVYSEMGLLDALCHELDALICDNAREGGQ